MQLKKKKKVVVQTLEIPTDKTKEAETIWKGRQIQF